MVTNSTQLRHATTSRWPPEELGRSGKLHSSFLRLSGSIGRISTPFSLHNTFKGSRITVVGPYRGMPLFRCILIRSLQTLRTTTVPCVSPYHQSDKSPGSIRSISTTPNTPVTPSSKSKAADHDLARYNRRSAANFDTIGSWNQRLTMEVDLEQSIRLGKLIPHLSLGNVGIASLLGRRKVNEDRYQYLQLTPTILMFAMFDGHGGPVAADYTAEHMYRHIKYWLERGETNLERVLRTAFIEVNNAFTRYLHFNNSGNEQIMNSGTTATVCLLRNGVELVTGWVGDSRALMCRRGKVVRLMQDHKPRDPAEKARIKAAGGKVVASANGTLRVGGKLDMTRSIGDVELKAIGVTAEPQTNSREVSHGKDAFLFLSTDGVNYVMNDQEIIDIICSYENTTEAAKFITDQALHFGSEDNCTAMVVPFGAWGKYAQSASTVQFSFGRNIIGQRYS